MSKAGSSERTQKWQAKRRAAGLCVRCGKQREPGCSEACRSCNAKRTEYNLKRSGKPRRWFNRCSECGELGHNKATCPEPPAGPYSPGSCP